MSHPPRARAFGLGCGRGKPGPRNSIADVPGVRVGHCTRAEGAVQTGVTALLPHGGNLFRDKPMAAAAVLNGFGKSTGLVQVTELGTLETPILLTNTLSVGTAATALVHDAIRLNPDIGRETATVNPLVFECNDGYLNDIQALAVTGADCAAALADCSEDFALGAVGAGRGMSCFGFKGGIGSASRRVRLDGGPHMLGVLALCNFGQAGDLTLPDGRHIAPPQPGETVEKGSVILILATDVPLDPLQLRRVAARAGVGLARLGAFWGHGSGDIALAFTTANRVDHDEPRALVPFHRLNDGKIDRLFEAAADGVQEAVLDALIAAEAVTGFAGHHRPALRDCL